jgi:hypothetical protein
MSRHLRVQCKACPWRRDVVAARDIPGGYCESKHAALAGTIAEPGSLESLSQPVRAMACHESPMGSEYECVGWVMHQLGPGNNIALRMLARDGRYAGYRTVGEQCESFEQTLKARTP